MAAKKARRTGGIFKVPEARWPDEEATLQQIEVIIRGIRQHGGEQVSHEIPSGVVKGMAEIATNAWRAKGKMVSSDSGEVREEMKRAYRHVEGILESLHEMGIELKDHTGDSFDYGMPLKVVTTEPTQGITKERVTETIKPTVFWQKKIIQMGEVVIATPA